MPAIGGPKPTSRLWIRSDPGHELGVYAMWIGAGQPYLLHWGDGSDPTPMSPVRPPTRHRYPTAGRYLIRGVTVDGAHDKSAWVELPWPDPQPTIEFWSGQLSVAVKWPATRPVGTWRVHWPDWPAETIVDPDPDTWFTRPALPGRPTVRVEYTSTGATTVSDPMSVTDVGYSVDFDLRVDGRTVTMRRTKPVDSEQDRPWWAYWGDEWDTGVAYGATRLEQDQASHTYPAAGVYTVETSSSHLGRVYVGVRQVTVS